MPRIVTLRRTTWACPTQWVATRDDGRTVHARSRNGEFSVGDDLEFPADLSIEDKGRFV
jgi:hypothetical protein